MAALDEFYKVATGQNCTPVHVVCGRIQMVRRFRGLTPDELGKRVHSSGPAIRLYEKGHMPSLGLTRAIADALGVSIDFLSGRQAHPDQDRDLVQPISHPNAAALVAVRRTNMDGSPIWEKPGRINFLKHS